MADREQFYLWVENQLASPLMSGFIFLSDQWLLFQKFRQSIQQVSKKMQVCWLVKIHVCEPHMVAHTCNSNTWKAETELSSRQACAAEWAWGQPVLHHKSQPKNRRITCIISWYSRWRDTNPSPKKLNDDVKLSPFSQLPWSWSVITCHRWILLLNWL